MLPNILLHFSKKILRLSLLAESKQYGKVYVRGAVYLVNPEIINGEFDLDGIEDEEILDDYDEMTSIFLEEGRIYGRVR